MENSNPTTSDIENVKVPDESPASKTDIQLPTLDIKAAGIISSENTAAENLLNIIKELPASPEEQRAFLLERFKQIAPPEIAADPEHYTPVLSPNEPPAESRYQRISQLERYGNTGLLIGGNYYPKEYARDAQLSMLQGILTEDEIAILETAKTKDEPERQGLMTQVTNRLFRRFIQSTTPALDRPGDGFNFMKLKRPFEGGEFQISSEGPRIGASLPLPQGEPEVLYSIDDLVSNEYR